MTLNQAVEHVQFCYPQIYYACHTRHERRRTGAGQLSGRDSQVLIHLDRTQPTTLTALARHMGLSPSTLSETVARLQQYGYLVKVTGDNGDRRQVAITLTRKGVDAVLASSVLEPARLRDALGRLSRRDLESVVDGLRNLARVARCSRA
jgi:DNA-binding MarR family transcriptional regulator